LGQRARKGFTPHPSWHSSLTGTSHQALSTITALSHPGTLVGFVQRRQMSYPFLALAKFNACYRSSLQWHSARAGNSCPDCRLNLGAKSDSLLTHFNYSRFYQNKRQETGDRRQETGDRRQETGDRRQGTGRQETETGAGELLSPPPPLPPSPLLPISPAPSPLLPISPAPHLTISPIPTPTHSPPHPKCKP